MTPADAPPSRRRAKPSLAATGAAAGSGSAEGPPILSFTAAIAVLAFTLVSFWLGDRVEIRILQTGREVDFNTFGWIVGCFVSIAVMHRFLKADGKARATRRYSEWRLLSARQAVVWMTVATWALGAAHLLFWAWDLTRP